MTATSPSLTTLLATAGIDPANNQSGMAPHLNLSSTFERAGDGTYPSGHIYSRMSNPTRDQLESSVREIETFDLTPSERESCTTSAFASGMAAVHAVLVARKNTTVVLPTDCYHGVPYQLDKFSDQMGVEFTLIDPTDTEFITAALKSALDNNRNPLLWIESPSNPLCTVVDISSLSSLAKGISEDIGVVVDATWTPPTITRPLNHGADVTLHSTTKFMGGHSDVLGGIVTSCGSTAPGRDIGQGAKDAQGAIGGVCAPFDAWLILRGLRSMDVRVERMCDNAEAVAKFLANDDRVARTHYPGLEGHPNHAVAKKQMKRFGSMLSFEVDGGEEAAMAVAARCKLISRATSLGGTESLIEHRASVEPEDRRISPEGLLRVSVGLEDVDDLISDLDQALN